MPPDPLRVRSYLLGGLPEDDLAAFEEHFFTDDVTFEALENAEWDLVDAYIEQRLSPDEQRAFQETFLSSPQRLRKIAIASGLRKLAAENFHPPQPSSQSGGLRRWPIAASAVAAALLGSVVWLWHDRSSLNRDLATQAQTIATLEKQLKSARVESAHALPKSEAPNPAVVSFLLAPGVLRDAQPRSLTLSSTLQTARFTLRVEGTQPYSRFRAALISQRQVKVWSSELPPSESAAYRPDPIEVPAAVLRPGQFVLTLEGRTTAGHWQPVNEYSFQIVRH